MAVAAGGALGPIGVSMQPYATFALNAFVAVAALWDLTERKIPNRLVVVGLLVAFGLQAQAAGLSGLGAGLAGSLAGFGLLFPMFALRQMGGGDVKLALTVGAFLDWRGAVHIVLFGTIAHGAIALLMLFRRKVLETMGRPALEHSAVPHAVGFALATWAYAAGFGHFF